MLRREVAVGLLASTVGATVSKEARAQSPPPPYIPQTPAEVAAGVTPSNYAYAEGNVLRYGADPTGQVPSDTAVLDAIAVENNTPGSYPKLAPPLPLRGGTVYFPPGRYVFANQIDLTQLSGITLQGSGQATGGAGSGTELVYSGSASAWILLMSAMGCVIENLTLSLAANSTFTGSMIQCGAVTGGDVSNVCAVADVLFNATLSCTHLMLSNCVNFTAERCNFVGGSSSVKGQQSDAPSNVIRFRDCQWSGCAAPPVLYGGESWSFEGCTFEPLSTGAAGAFHSGGYGFQGLAFRDCWFGDSTPADGGTWIIAQGQGLVVTGCLFSTGGGPSAAYGIDLRPVSGFSVKGNVFQNLDIAINFGVATSVGGDISGNCFAAPPSLTEVYGNLANASAYNNFNPNSQLAGANVVSQESDGFEVTPNGIVRQWGSVTVMVSSGIGSSPVSFKRAFSQQCWNIQVTVQGSSASNNTVWTSAPSLAGCTIGAAGQNGELTLYWTAIGV